jgi:hypothetical protein
MAEAAILAAITVTMMLALSYFLGTCVEVPDWQQKNYGFTFHCPEGTRRPCCSSGNILSDQDPLFSAKCGVEAVRCCGSAGKYNDLATAFMAFPVKTISHLFSLGSLTPQVVIVPNLHFTCIL